MSCDNCKKEIEDEYKFNNKFYCDGCSMKKIYCTHCGNKSPLIKYLLFEKPLCIGCERNIDLYDKYIKSEEQEHCDKKKIELFVTTTYK